jgi:hypothetical protein
MSRIAQAGLITASFACSPAMPRAIVDCHHAGGRKMIIGVDETRQAGPRRLISGKILLVCGRPQGTPYAVAESKLGKRGRLDYGAGPGQAG